jgi:glutathionylspermidine synthase
LGLPCRIRQVLSDDSAPPTPAAARVIRFDFHPTPEGWRISEANCDVPGGYAESSHFSRLMAEHWPGLRPVGDPVAALADALHRHGPGRVGLLAATGYMEDQQVVACLADALRRRGWKTAQGHPGQVEWRGGRAYFPSVGALDAVVRFFQGEWLARMRDVSRWRPFFRGARSPVLNPGTAILTESKRFPLVWDELKTPLATWRSLLPETRDPRRADWRRDPTWLLKAAFGNNGDEVIDRRSTGRKSWRSAKWSARLRPGGWAAQQRFATLSVETPDGPMYPCLGVYTVDGRASGIYGRIAPKSFIDYAAVDVAVLQTSGAARLAAPNQELR